ncbi:MAG: TRAP transporter permease [Candidatus Odyssella sp.]|nr:TRAP transporter permease [Candidatus Odyssella sp.]
MSSDRGGAPPAEVSADRLHKAEAFVEQEEGALNRFGGWLGHLVTALAAAMSLFHLYAAFFVVPPETLRAIHVGAALFLIFLLYPVARRFRHRLAPWDVALALVAAATIGYLLLGGDDLRDRQSLPNQTDMVVGAVFLLLVLEACRRSTGLVLVAVVAIFLLYGMFGNHLPMPWTNRGYDLARIVGHLYISLEGVFGPAIDVSATLIILFTIYGAVLNATGAGKFYIDFSFAAMGGRPTAAGRTIVVASFLLGGPSGSGVATTVTLGSVAYPMLAKAGYTKNAAGGLLAAGGIGAIISPPVLGAAAFLIAEFLKISYLDVIMMAVVPTCLYYFALLAQVEIDSRKFRSAAHAAAGPAGGAAYLHRLGRIYAEGGHHFLSLVLIIVFMLAGLTPMLAVVWATVVAAVSTFFPPLIGGTVAALSLAASIVLPGATLALIAPVFQPTPWAFAAIAAVVVVAALALRVPVRMTFGQLVRALREGSVGMLNVAATCAAAGIIVGIATLTGLGQKFASIIIEYAGGSLILTALYSGLVVWVVGLAVPVTASYIICAQIVAPALIKLGVPEVAAHMFIFYYAVLSEVSPPTALSPFAAAAITGGGPYATTLQAWKYCLPAFVVPLAFVLEPNGVGLLLKMPKGGDVWDVALVTAETALGIVALAGAFQGWLLRKASPAEAVLLGVAGSMLVVTRIVAAILSPVVAVSTDALSAAGAGLFAAVLAWQIAKRRDAGRAPAA